MSDTTTVRPSARIPIALAVIAVALAAASLVVTVSRPDRSANTKAEIDTLRQQNADLRAALDASTAQLKSEIRVVHDAVSAIPESDPVATLRLGTDLRDLGTVAGELCAAMRDVNDRLDLFNPMLCRSLPVWVR